MKKHIARVLVVGATVATLLAFGMPSVALPPSKGYTVSPEEKELIVPEYEY